WPRWSPPVPLPRTIFALPKPMRWPSTPSSDAAPAPPFTAAPPQHRSSSYHPSTDAAPQFPSSYRAGTPPPQFPPRWHSFSPVPTANVWLWSRIGAIGDHNHTLERFIGGAG